MPNLVVDNKQLKDENTELKKQIEELNAKLVQKERDETEKKDNAKQIAEKDVKKKYYEIIVQNRDTLDGEPDFVDFFANDKRVILKPGNNHLVSETAYENLTERCIQTRSRPSTDSLSDKPHEKFDYHRFPVYTVAEYMLTEDEYVAKVKELNKKNESKAA